jgi:glycerophosphoryl diester phosphodiesterase
MRTIAHRGASGYAPENTAAAFDLAIEMRADAIETDVQATADGYLVLVHDTAIDRTSNGSGSVADHTLADLRSLDFGSWFGKEFAGQRIVTLEEALTTWLDRIPFALEIKDPRAALPIMEQIPETPRIEITSFHWDALMEARERNSAYRFGYLTSQFDTAMIRQCLEAGLQQICPHADTVTREMVDLAHASRLEVRAWGVSRREQIHILLDSGADGTTCNWPDWIT